MQSLTLFYSQSGASLWLYLYKCKKLYLAAIVISNNINWNSKWYKEVVTHFKTYPLILQFWKSKELLLMFIFNKYKLAKKLYRTIITPSISDKSQNLSLYSAILKQQRTFAQVNTEILLNHLLLNFINIIYVSNFMNHESYDINHGMSCFTWSRSLSLSLCH